MFQHQGIWLPDGEKHFPEWMTKNGEMVDGKGTYQIKKFREAMRWVKNWRGAVDVGAHVGLWSMHMAKRFRLVHAFEPVMEFRQCWSANLGPRGTFMCDDTCDEWEEIADVVTEGVVLHGAALGAERDLVFMAYDQKDSGGTHVATGRAAAQLRNSDPVEMRTLDSFDLCEVDFLKIDCEGFEHHVLAGAVDTLRRCRPCVIVEQKPHKLGPNFGIQGTPAVDLLRSLGAEVRVEMGGDYVMSWS